MEKSFFPFPSSSMNFLPQDGLSLRERGGGQEAPFHEESREMPQFRNIFLRFTSSLDSSYFGEHGNIFWSNLILVRAAFLSTLTLIFERLGNSKPESGILSYCFPKTSISG